MMTVIEFKWDLQPDALIDSDQELEQYFDMESIAEDLLLQK